MTAVTKLEPATDKPKPVRKSKLLAVAPETVEPSKPKFMIWGTAGVGKTWFALQFPGVYFIDCEGGAKRDHYRQILKDSGGVYLGPEQGALDFDTVIEQVEELATTDHPYKTVVIDSISKLFNNAVIEEQIRLDSAKTKDEYGLSKKPAVRSMGKLLKWINRGDLNAVLISHEKDEYSLVGKQREVVGRTFEAYDKLAYELDFNLRITKIGKGDSSKRFATIGKSRLIGFKEGDTFDFNYPEFAERYGKDVIEKEVKPIVLATEDQIAEVNRILTVAPLPEGMKEKWLSKAGVDSWAEMDTETIEKCLIFLKGRV